MTQDQGALINDNAQCGAGRSTPNAGKIWNYVVCDLEYSHLIDRCTAGDEAIKS